MPQEYRVYSSTKTIPVTDTAQVGEHRSQSSSVQFGLELQIEKALNEVEVGRSERQSLSSSELWQRWSRSGDEVYQEDVLVDSVSRFTIGGYTGLTNRRITVHYLFDRNREHLVLAHLDFLSPKKGDELFFEKIFGVYDKFFSNGS